MQVGHNGEQEGSGAHCLSNSREGRVGSEAPGTEQRGQETAQPGPSLSAAITNIPRPASGKKRWGTLLQPCWHPYPQWFQIFMLVLPNGGSPPPPETLLGTQLLIKHSSCLPEVLSLCIKCHIILPGHTALLHSPQGWLQPTSGSVLTSQSLEPAPDSVSPSLSAPPPRVLCFCLSKINKC